jgi:hypothetical protein
MGVGLRALAIDTIVTIDIHKYCSAEFLMLKNISNKNDGLQKFKNSFPSFASTSS